jgi:conjugative transfer region protein (TIGR03750 family)
METENKLLPNRLNGEPAIFKGCSLSELMILTGAGAAICIPLSLVVCGVLGFMMAGVGIGVLATIGSVVVGSLWLQKAKRGRPIGFYQLRLKLMLEDRGIIKTGFIRQSQVWGIGRTVKGKR